jgi:hypothetical protein
MTEKRIFDGVAVILEAVDFVATVEENEWSRGTQTPLCKTGRGV